MSVVIIGGNERMEQQYKEICKRYRCKAKVFTRMSGNLKTQIGQPDLIILFTSTVAHKMSTAPSGKRSAIISLWSGLTAAAPAPWTAC